MKKMLLGIALAAVVGFAATQVLAWSGSAGAVCPGMGQPGYAMNQERAAFMQDTARLRADLLSARAERRSLLQGASPDAAKLKEINRNIAELKTQMQLKAKEHGWSSCPRAKMGGWHGGSRMMHAGPGHGPGGCWRR
jgi:ribosomal protein L29